MQALFEATVVGIALGPEPTFSTGRAQFVFRDPGASIEDLDFLRNVDGSRMWLVVKGVGGLALTPPATTPTEMMIAVGDDGSARVLGANPPEIDFDEMAIRLGDMGYQGVTGQHVVLDWVAQRLDAVTARLPLVDLSRI